MNRPFPPASLILVLMVLTLGAVALVYWPPWERPAAARAVPLPVPEGDQEVVWLHNATNTAAWERFVAAVRRLQESPGLGLRVVEDGNAFPALTTSVPELAVTRAGARGRLWFRWYKLTGDTGTAEWVRALGQRQPPPLAIIGGNSSDRARDLALELNRLRPAPPTPPLLLITTATADVVDGEEGSRDLMTLYPGRSFRFCFTNRQMARAVTDFIWEHPDLRPDTDPVYLVHWEDDPYSEDLFEHYHEVLGPDRYGGLLHRARTTQAVARDWASVAGRVAGGGFPLPFDLESSRLSPSPFLSLPIPYSEGNPDQPNGWEEEAARKLMDARAQHLTQRRPLLVLPANPRPAHRFLRALTRTAPLEAGGFVVATGDAIEFDTVYRDRALKWPIQDLPFDLVLFYHRNPVDPAAFLPDRQSTGLRPEFLSALAASPAAPAGPALSWSAVALRRRLEEPDPDAVPDPMGRTSSGSEDVMLYQDIVETVLRGAYPDAALVAGPDGLAHELRSALRPDGRTRFDARGNQHSGGEFVVCLRPVRAGQLVLPRAVLQVWYRVSDGAGRRWERVPIDGMAELVVGYGSVPAPSPAGGGP